MPFCDILIDSIKINGATVEGFEDGTLNAWDIDSGGDMVYYDVSDYDPYEGTYNGVFFVENTGTLGAYLSLGEVTSSDTIEFHYMCGVDAYECTYLRAEIYITNGDYYYPFVQYYDMIDFEHYDEGWITVGASELSVFGLEDPTSLIFAIYIDIVGGGGGGTEYAIIQFDDIDVLGESEWTEFLNGDFELGDLSHWNVVGSPTVSTDHVHDGIYSCVVNNGDSITQRISLAGMDQLNVYYYITACTGSLYVEVTNLETVPYATWTHAATTSGWYQLRLDVSAATGDGIINIVATDVMAYIDDISSQAEFDTEAQVNNFDTRSLWHTTYNPAWNTVSNVSYAGGIDGPYCARLYTAYKYADTCNAAIHNYYDVTVIDSISFMYTIPTFVYGYIGMGGAWLKAKLEQDGSPTLTYIVADADYGAVADWTEYSIDVSNLTGVYKLTIYAEATDAGYTLHPLADAYIDNILPHPFPIYLTQSLYLRHQYNTDSRCTETFHNDVPLASVTDRLFSHRLTDTGRFIDFDEESMTDSGAIHYVKKIRNIMNMRLRRVK